MVTLHRAKFARYTDPPESTVASCAQLANAILYIYDGCISEEEEAAGEGPGEAEVGCVANRKRLILRAFITLPACATNAYLFNPFNRTESCRGGRRVQIWIYILRRRVCNVIGRAAAAAERWSSPTRSARELPVFRFRNVNESDRESEKER